MLAQLAADFRLDHGPEQSEHRSQLDVHRGHGFTDRDSALGAVSGEAEGVSGPGHVAQPESGRKRTRQLVDCGAAALLASGMGVLEMDFRHRSAGSCCTAPCYIARILNRYVMRVVCFHPARDPAMCGEGPVQIGSAPDDTIILNGAGVEPHHLQVVADARGLVLTIRPGCQRVYVNARAVRERALLHYGDTVTLGTNKFLVTSNVAPPEVEEVASPGASMGEAVLRIVSGAASGQALAVAPELHLGAGSRHFGDLPYACRVARAGGNLVFESDSGVPRINGWRRNRVRLAPNDQIALGEHRFTVEAPGLQYARHLASLPPPVEQAPEALDQDESAPTEIWWLIAAAAILAAVIALFLYFRW